MHTENVSCRDCGKQAPEVTIASYTIPPGSKYGHCATCLAAPECEGCGAHTVADKATIKGVLCGECRGNLTATVIPAPVSQPAPVAAKVKRSKARKPAMVA